jgi:hypothetical protein
VSAGIVTATIRLTVVGDHGRADLAVPLWVDVATLAESYADVVGLAAPPRLATSTGRALDGHRTVEQSGLGHGDLVVSLPDASGSHTAPARRGSAARGPAADRSAPWLLALPPLLSAVCGSAAGVVLAVSDASGPTRSVGLALLVLCALVAAAPVSRAAGSARARTAAAPAFGFGAGFAATYTDAAGGLLLGVATACLAAAVVAGIGRAFLDHDHDELVDVWLVVGAAVAVVATALLMAGASPHALWAVLFGAAVVAARLLPSTVVDVPDDALLDLDRLAVTAWSARERPRGSRRRRSMVRYDGVRAVVRRGQRLVAAGTVLIAVVCAVTGPLVVDGAGTGPTGIGSLVLVGLGGFALAMVARSFRFPLPRLVLRLAAGCVLAFVGLEVMDGLGERWTWAVFAGLVLLAGVATAAAVALGRGWRSIWWTRVADAAEGLAVVLVVAAVPLASGLFDAVRAFAS